jgi:hypothetical protein
VTAQDYAYIAGLIAIAINIVVPLLLFAFPKSRSPL